MDSWESLLQAARRLERVLARVDVRIVLAESCTGGLAAAALVAIPGISRWFCGSAVTYRDATKVGWLGVSASDIEHSTAVSRVVAEQMAAGVLALTPEARWGASVTGHLGPDAPDAMAGTVWVGTACRAATGSVSATATCYCLGSIDRRSRQCEAAALLLQRIGEAIDMPGQFGQPGHAGAL